MLAASHTRLGAVACEREAGALQLGVGGEVVQHARAVPGADHGEDQQGAEHDGDDGRDLAAGELAHGRGVAAGARHVETDDGDKSPPMRATIRTKALNHTSQKRL